MISKWVIMNAETKRLAKLTDELRDELAPHVKDPPRYASAWSQLCECLGVEVGPFLQMQS